MLTRIIHFLLYVIFGISAGIRYLFFLVIGRKKRYSDLIEAKGQDKWNSIVMIAIILLVIFLDLKYGVHLEDKHKHPPIDQLMHRKR